MARKVSVVLAVAEQRLDVIKEVRSWRGVGWICRKSLSDWRVDGLGIIQSAGISKPLLCPGTSPLGAQ